MNKFRTITLLSLVCFFCSFNIKAQQKPNIVIIYIDDLGYGDLSCYGAKKIHTPNIDALAEGGIKFTDAHCAAATCTPSRLGLLTGTYPFRANAGILPGNAPLIIDTTKPTMASMLKQHGYKTAVIGKWHLGLGDGNVNWNEEVKPGPKEIGFDYSYLIPATGDRVPCVMLENQKVVNLDVNDPITISYKSKVGTDPTFIERPDLVRYPADKQHGKTIVNGVSRIGYMSGGNSARWKDETIPYLMLDKANHFIDEAKEDPFFLYFAFHEIHVPHMPGEKFKGSTNLGLRGDAIVQMDYITGKLIDCLKSKGKIDNTLIIFSSDNGPVLYDGYKDGVVYDNGSHKPGGAYSGGKYSCHEGGTRVPTIAYWPKKIKPGQTSDALFSHVDIYSTLASIVDHKLKGDEALDSQNHLESLLGEDKVGRTYLLQDAVSFSLRYGKWKYIKPVANENRFGWVDAKMIDSGVSEEDQLYNLSIDKPELRNVARDNKKTVSRMQKELERILLGDRTR